MPGFEPRAPFRFESVYAEHAPFVWRSLRGMGLNGPLLKDAMQDVFLVVHRRLPEFDGRHAIRTWLFAIAYRVASDHRRRLSRARAHEPLDESLQAPTHTPAEAAEHAEDVRLLERLLDGFPEEKRALLILAELEQMTVPEIAAALEVPLNTAYTRLRRVRQEFSRALAKLRGRST